MVDNDVGRAPSGQALVSDEARSGLHPPGFDPSRGVFIFTITLSGIDDEGDLSRTAYHGYAMADTENEARGFAVKSVREKEPSFAIHQIMVLRIPDKFVIAAASAIEARRAETAQHGSVGDESAGPKDDAQPTGGDAQNDPR